MVLKTLKAVRETHPTITVKISKSLDEIDILVKKD